VIAVDTNILVYAHRRDSAWHEPAVAKMAVLCEGGNRWALPWPCVHEFLAIVTHPEIYSPPSTIAQALDQVEVWLAAPGILLLTEGEGHWLALRGVVEGGRTRGPQMHDARVAALCHQHGIDQLWTADRDFARFRGVKTHNPLVD
jgi:uncharacterized protein